MQQWEWIGNYTIVRTGAVKSAIVNGSVTYDTALQMWKWMIMADNVKIKGGLCVTARLALQEVDSYFAEGA